MTRSRGWWWKVNKKRRRRRRRRRRIREKCNGSHYASLLPQPLVTSCSRVYLHTKGLPLRFVALLLLSISRSSEDASFTRYGRARKYRSSFPLSRWIGNAVERSIDPRFRHNFVLNSNSLASRVIKFYINIEIHFSIDAVLYIIYIYRLMRKFSLWFDSKFVIMNRFD